MSEAGSKLLLAGDRPSPKKGGQRVSTVHDATPSVAGDQYRPTTPRKPEKPMDENALIFCAWCGPAFLLIYFGGLVIAKQFPALSPSMSAEQLAHFYQSDTNLIRTGLVIAFLGTAFYLPFSAVISSQIRRMEGSAPVLAYAQLIGGAGGLVNFLIPMMILILAAFRPYRSPEITQTLHDLAWLIMVILLTSNCVQYFAIARAVIKDHEHSAEPIFPRWIIYLNYITGLSFFIDVLLAFYKSGPFAWNGLLCLYVPAVIWTMWLFAMAYVLTKAIRRQAQLERGETGVAQR